MTKPGALVVRASSQMDEASRLAERSLIALAALRERRSLKPSSGSNRKPSWATATAADLVAAEEWFDVFMSYFGNGLELIGEVNVEMSYSTGQSVVVFEPTLESLETLRDDCIDGLRELLPQAPISELESVRDAGRANLSAIASFHDHQLDWFRRFTPRSFDDGSYAVVAAEFQAGYQQTIDSIVPSAASLSKALAASVTAMNVALRG